jgi:hypothetical protein
MIERRIKLTDLKWSIEGDFIIENGDLADTKNIAGLAFLQEVSDRVKSSFADWELMPDRGSNLDEFIGSINSARTQKAIEDAISFSFTKDNFLDRKDFQIAAVPIDNTQIAVRIDFETSLTEFDTDSTIQFKLIYDTSGKGPFIVR